MRSNRKLWVGVGGGLVVLVLLLGGVKAGQIVTMVRAGESFAPPPEAVSSARVQSAEWEAARDTIGSLVATRGVTLATELPGTVREIAFESGSFVRKGTLLVRLDTSTEQAQLAAAQADAALARVSLERARQLREHESNTPADIDAAEARAKQTDAAVAALEATIAKKTIRAPFDGRISHPAGRARPGRRARDPRRVPPVGLAHLRGVLASPAGARGRPGAASGPASGPTRSRAPPGRARSRR